ncbi:MAG: patatin-like phospholipase family protein [Planctomycetota bacterium]
MIRFQGFTETTSEAARHLDLYQRASDAEATSKRGNPSATATCVLALGGGGARGLAHFGATQAVFESGCKIRRFVGTSIGSLVGAMLATCENPFEPLERVVNYVESEDFKTKQELLCGAHPKQTATHHGLLGWYDQIRSFLWARQMLTRVFRRRSFLSGQVIEEVIADLVPDIDIADTITPLSIVAVDLKTGHQVVLERGSLRTAVLASAAIPGIFPPVFWDDMLLADFGVLDSLPTQVARSYASDCPVIGVDIGPHLDPVDDCESALHVLLRMDEISERLYRRHSYTHADIVIRPEVGNFEWFDFSEPRHLIRTGLEAGRIALSHQRI